MRLLALIGILAILAGVASAVFFFGGFFNIAANYEDPPPIAWVLVHVRQASIDHHATDAPPANLADAAVIRAGAKTFAANGCVHCHGGPGVPWSKFSEGLNPGPPDLKEVVPELQPRELFWVVKNGIRMTGMPGFGAIIQDQDLWPLVAFLKKLPTVTDADYKTWTASTP